MFILKTNFEKYNTFQSYASLIEMHKPKVTKPYTIYKECEVLAHLETFLSQIKNSSLQFHLKYFQLS